MIINYNNHVFNATIDSFSDVPEYPFNTALNDTRLSRLGRTVGDTAEWFKFSLSSAVDVDRAFILTHNITSGATVNLQGNATDVWTSPSVDVTMVWGADYITYVFSATESYQYWRITVADSSNPDGYIEMSYVSLSEDLIMPGMDTGQIISKKTNSRATKSIGGQLYGDRLLDFKAAQINLPDIEESKRTEINTFFDTVDITRPFILLIWEDDLDIEPPIYCALTEEIEWNKQPLAGGLLWTMSLNFEEAF